MTHIRIYIHARHANWPQMMSSAVLPESSPMRIVFFATCFMSRFVVTVAVGISHSTTAKVLPDPVAPATDGSGHLSIHSPIEILTTFLTNFLAGDGESLAKAALFFEEGESMNGRFLFSAAWSTPRGGDEKLAKSVDGAGSVRFA